MRPTRAVAVTAAVLSSLLAMSMVKLTLVENELDTATVTVADSRPAWCNWPDAADQVALTKSIDGEVANIHKYSPDYTPDRFTLQLDLMSRCGTPAGMRQ